MNGPSVNSRLGKVCAVIAEETVDAARAAMNNAETVADLIELRLDFLRDFDFADASALANLLEGKSLPVIITCRSAAEGGRQEVDDPVRLRLLVEGARRFADYCDIEAAHYDQAIALSPDLSRLIVSYHNFERTPVDLDAVYNRITALPAGIHKIVTHANTITDSLAILELLDRARREGRQLIAIAMGLAGVITRVLGPSRGSFLTYGSIASGKESAAGQPTCDELTGLYRIRRLSRETNITGIIGSPVAHSASPAMHNRAFAELGLDFVYLPLEVHDVAGFVRRMVRPDSRDLDWNLRGFSVTIPHKTTIIPLLDQLDETARAVGAANTVVVRDGSLIGYNTDVIGAMAPIERAVEIKGLRCGVIGAGGAARAVIHGLLERGAAVIVFGRDPEKARAVAEPLKVDILPIASLASSDVTVVINTTPVGMRGHSEGQSPVPRSAWRGRAVAYDLVYNPLETRFLADARAEGCQTISGIDMLVAQAAYQFELWTGEKPPIEAMRESACLRVKP
ncbi:MAG TPA: shikimate dehydrogenase [Blastocatellia bacterium]|nr:shikimate dehydrogenase [Blastocatellia bacterium]